MGPYWIDEAPSYAIIRLGSINVWLLYATPWPLSFNHHFVDQKTWAGGQKAYFKNNALYFQEQQEWKGGATSLILDFPSLPSSQSSYSTLA